MTHSIKARSALTLLFASAALSAGAIAAVPAHAGPLSFIKKAVKKELKETFEATTESVVDSAMQAAVETTFKVEKGEAAQAASSTPPMKTLDRATPDMANAGQEGGGLWNADNAAVGGQGGGGIYNDGGRSAANGDGQDDLVLGAGPSRNQTSQNGTTVETASQVQAQNGEGAALLLPAVQANRASARPQRAKLRQNGTTVATASEVQAPSRRQAVPPQNGKAKVEAGWKTEEGTKNTSRPGRKMSQNGTTVATASEVQAHERD